MLDTLADHPIEDVVDALPLSNDVVDALVHRAGVKGRVSEAAIAYERAEWGSLPRIGIPAAEVSGAYLEAMTGPAPCRSSRVVDAGRPLDA